MLSFIKYILLLIIFNYCSAISTNIQNNSTNYETPNNDIINNVVPITTFWLIVIAIFNIPFPREYQP